MKLIRKMRLINWHFFDDQTIDFGNINVITGANGSGKSTLLDALHYFISGGTCKFNTAANSLGSGRSVESYLRAKVGVEGKDYLRDSDDIIGHIAVEFYDDSARKPLVIGLVVQLVQGKTYGPHYYRISGSVWNDALFFSSESEVNGIDELIAEGREQGLDIKPLTLKASSRKKRKEAIEDALGIQDKYEALFTKAISFEPLPDISSFAIDFLLPEEALDLTSIKDAILGYRRIQETVDSETKRAKELKPIADNKDRYENLQKKIFALDLLILKGEMEAAESRIKTNKVKIEAEQRSADDHQAKVMAYQRKAAESNKNAEDIRDSDKYKVLKDLDDKKTSISKQFEEAKKDRERFEQRLLNEMKQAGRIGLSFDLGRIMQTHDFDAYLVSIDGYATRINKLRVDLSQKNGALKAQMEEKKGEREEVIREIKGLEQKHHEFPPYVRELQAEIKKRILNTKGDSSAYAEPLSVFLEINDSDWVDAIEGLLGRRRFDFFVNPKYWEIAKQCFDGNARLKDYFQAGVIQPQTGEVEVPEDSLARKIDSFRDVNGEKRTMAEPRRYIDSLLGDIHCVDSIAEFRPGVKAITKEGVYFDGKSIRYVSKEAMEKPYIGQKSIEKRLALAKERKRALDGKIEEIETEISQNERRVDEANRSNANYLQNDRNDYWKKEKDVSDELNDVLAKIKEIKEKGEGLDELEELISKFIKDAERYRRQSKEESDQAQTCFQRIGGLKEKIEADSQKIDEDKKKYSDKVADCPYLFENLEDYLLRLEEGKRGEELRQFALLSKGPTRQSLTSVENEIRNAQSIYCSNHPGEFTPDVSNYLAFVQRYNRIVEDELAKLQPQLEDARKKSEEELRLGFISKIRKSLVDAKSDIASLNRSLEAHPFGNGEVYRSEAKPSTDSLLRRIYHIAMDTNQGTDSVTNLFTEPLSKENEEAYDEVLDLLVRPEDDPEYRDRREQVLDYRRYMNYDIKITLPNGDEMSYSRNQDAKSGGETQTPFYAMIAAAFQSIIALPEKRGYSPCCIVAFDEAFNNMDGERISQMLEFYRELKIQLVISVPSSRFSYIAPYADNIVSLARTGSSVAVYTGTRKNA